MHKTILDTDILSDFLRGRNLNVVRRVDAYLREHGHLTVSVVTAFEIIRGRHQAQQFERAAQFLEWTKGAELLAFDEICARVGGEIAGALLRTGTTVGVADALIAATAITHDLALVTANVEHYQRMSSFGLRIENWRDAEPSANTP
jgi:tRNA(fMet)-specific endonuclease VapC